MTISSLDPRSLATWAAAACALALGACAHVPVIDAADLAKASVGSRIKVYGARGPLSARQSQAVMNRLAAQAPDAGALERHIAVEQVASESPLFTGNHVTILRDGAETFPAMFAAIRGAKRYIFLEYYIFEDVTCDGESLSDLLLEKTQAGVQVRIIYDGIGSITTDTAFFDKLRNAGIQLVEFNPLNPLKHHSAFNSRDHRKLLIADGDLVILGGVNLSSTYQSGPGSAAGQAPTGDKKSEVWHDIDVAISGPVVPELGKLFRDHWREQVGEQLATGATADVPQARGDEVVRILGSSPVRLKSRYYVTVISAIRSAESSIWIMGAYFVPTHQEKEGLLAAARRGVDVRLLLPAHSDSGPAMAVQHSHYTELMRAGVKIYERSDGILHSKTMVIDQVWSIVGSSNFDHRSVLFNDEVDAVVLGKETGARLAADFTADLQHAQAIDPEQWQHRSMLERVRESFWRLWEQLL